MKKIIATLSLLALMFGSVAAFAQTTPTGGQTKTATTGAKTTSKKKHHRKHHRKGHKGTKKSTTGTTTPTKPGK